jgi:hypothetical protein
MAYCSFQRDVNTKTLAAPWDATMASYPWRLVKKGQVMKIFIFGLFCVEVFEKVNSSNFHHIGGATYTMNKVPRLTV